MAVFDRAIVSMLYRRLGERLCPFRMLCGGFWRHSQATGAGLPRGDWKRNVSFRSKFIGSRFLGKFS